MLKQLRGWGSRGGLRAYNRDAMLLFVVQKLPLDYDKLNYSFPPGHAHWQLTHPHPHLGAF